MIPDLPKSVDDGTLLAFYDTLSGQYSDQSTLHLHWHTHKGNPASCWICDTNVLVQKLLNLAGKYITKSPLDMETELSSEDDSDAEIETDYNVNEEPEIPEEEDSDQE